MGKKIKTSKELGEKIKRLRRELGISQEKLAEILEITYHQIQRYENGTNRLNVENIQVIANALSVPVSYFFEPDKTPFYLPADERKLLRYFRNIKDATSKTIVILTAKLAARVGK